MTITIRIDDDVYAWLQKHGRPFETPNAALRRIAKLEPENRGVVPGRSRRKRSQTGAELLKRWNIPARKALYSKDGTFYHRLTEFPGALCDQGGYTVFMTKQDYLDYPGVQVGKKTNVPRGVSKLDGYIKKV